MKIAVKDAVASTDIIYPCGHCNIMYKDYKTLVQHLFWRHGTESQFCRKCCMKRWRYAAHICNVLPFEDKQYDEEVDETICTQEAPVCTQEAPVYTQEAPVCAQEAPVYTQAAPVCTQEAPVYTQEAPFYTQEAPVHIQEAPVDTHEVPVYTQEAPEDKQEHRDSEFCICGKYIYNSKMIGCDAKACHYQWFHYSCVGILEPPDGEWFCPTCTKLETTKATQNSNGAEEWFLSF
ncbi:uncharacterized protein LOC114363819 [Ostrinia furnacalis]|uniref:uncharacterized protein LOC114363819 n=1 Tax=Ostrinia furnacalis TaxID=93504 RepID=UPI00103F4CB1|nr:uncharacterized protein LOC114363819 [Ostrinia furnacalis]